MTTSELMGHYRTIAAILGKQDALLARLLASDYWYITYLLDEALRDNDMTWLIGQLRSNLNRRASYIHCEKRNKTLQVAAKTIERLEASRGSTD